MTTHMGSEGTKEEYTNMPETESEFVTSIYVSFVWRFILSWENYKLQITNYKLLNKNPNL